MISDIVRHLDYLVVIVLAIIVYRLLGAPLAFKV